jgi:hypothetical protein
MQSSGSSSSRSQQQQAQTAVTGVPGQASSQGSAYLKMPHIIIEAVLTISMLAPQGDGHTHTTRTIAVLQPHCATDSYMHA